MYARASRFAFFSARMSKRLLYVELDADGDAPHLHYGPTSTTGRSRPTSPAWNRSSPAPSAPGPAACWNIRPRATPSRTSSGASRGGAFVQAGPNRQDRGGGKDRLTKEPSYWPSISSSRNRRADPTLGSTRANGASTSTPCRHALRSAWRVEVRAANCTPAAVLGGLLVVPAGLLCTEPTVLALAIRKGLAQLHEFAKQHGTTSGLTDRLARGL
jgi:hypothetical protein